MDCIWDPITYSTTIKFKHLGNLPFVFIFMRLRERGADVQQKIPEAHYFRRRTVILVRDWVRLRFYWGGDEWMYSASLHRAPLCGAHAYNFSSHNGYFNWSRERMWISTKLIGWFLNISSPLRSSPYQWNRSDWHQRMKPSLSYSYFYMYL